MLVKLKIITVGSIPLAIDGKTQKAAQCCDAAWDGCGKKSYCRLTCFLSLCGTSCSKTCETRKSLSQTKAKKTGTCYSLISALAKSSLLKFHFSCVKILKYINNVTHENVKILSCRFGSQTKQDECINHDSHPAEWEVQQYCCFVSNDRDTCFFIKDVKFIFWQPVWYLPL